MQLAMCKLRHFFLDLNRLLLLEGSKILFHAICLKYRFSCWHLLIKKKKFTLNNAARLFEMTYTTMCEETHPIVCSK